MPEASIKAAQMPASGQDATAELLLFANPDQLNEATSAYVETIAMAAASLGRHLRHVTRLDDIGSRDCVLVLECKSAFRLRLARPQAKVWLWMQGLYPEEARLHFSSRSREWLQRQFERFSLPWLQGVVMVSQAMRTHFESRYPKLRISSFVMPCVNSRLDEQCFRLPGKYDQPRFVYAGSLHAWQCLPQTLAVFRRFRAARPEARLSIFTRDTAAARALADAAGLADVEVAFVPLAHLQERLAAFKYGFVLREDHVVNRVATPTKVSSYMAAGVIPVMTRAVHDYNAALGATAPMVMSSRLDVELIARDLLALDARRLDPEEVLCNYRRAFETYFDHSAYLDGLRAFFGRTGMGHAMTGHYSALPGPSRAAHPSP